MRQGFERRPDGIETRYNLPMTLDRMDEPVAARHALGELFARKPGRVHTQRLLASAEE